MSGRMNLNPLLIRPPESNDEMGPLPLAYVVEGPFKSYFAERPLPERPAKGTGAEKEGAGPETGETHPVDLSMIQGEGAFLAKGRPGKIFVMATSEVLQDNLLDVEGKSPNAMFLMNVIDFLNDREDVARMRSKEQRFNPLTETGSGAKAFVKTFNIVGLPFLVVLLGLLVWCRRLSRRRRLQMMFEGWGKGK